ncbi:hypothetical protein HELRODRAFT_71528 [Helobdella robusta]|uniref:G-protein coupled receptors family 1 profile domain-containing protein n=1 Tax=Helobdella robusta TaxID=6412 RepID=T1G0M7_HELRO|nr:hypothetical protein HELRODRAFT_71528 [Helobdella robusta]ESO11503.1 hypothetical protein HELRODRAFT_71528 [Helobdella robusta]
MPNNKKSRMNFFICHLAIADLCTGVLVVFVDIVWKLTIEWEADNITCKIVRVSQFSVLYASSFILVSLSIDRVLAVARPLSWSAREKSKYWLVGSAWFLAVLASLPMLAFIKKKFDENIQMYLCVIDVQDWQLYIVLNSLLAFIIPAIIITVCYVIIVYVINTSTNERPMRRACMSATANHAQDRSGFISRAKVKSIKMTFAIRFIFCWSTFYVYNFLMVFKAIQYKPELMVLTIFVQSLAPLNSAVNPIIYFLFKNSKSAGVKNNRFVCVYVCVIVCV